MVELAVLCRVVNLIAAGSVIVLAVLEILDVWERRREYRKDK